MGVTLALSLDLVLLTDGLVLCAVHLSNLHLLVLLESLCQLVPSRGQLLAVTAPRGVELNEGVPLANSASERCTAENIQAILDDWLSRLRGSRLLLRYFVSKLLCDELL